MKIYFIIFSILLGNCAAAQTSDSVYKKNYHLFNPTPKSLRRDFATDRPDITESAYTVDAGHFQLETDLYKRTVNKDENNREIVTNFNNMNLKLGLTNRTDLQFVVNSYERSIFSRPVRSESSQVFGSLDVRVKQNIFGNDKGKIALAIMPFVNVPLRKNDPFAAGIIVPAAFELPQGWTAGAQVEIDMEKSKETNLEATYIASATAGHEIIKNLSFFVETVVSYAASEKKIFNSVNGGLTYGLSENFVLDSGTYYITTTGGARSIFLGCSFRL